MNVLGQWAVKIALILNIMLQKTPKSTPGQWAVKIALILNFQTFYYGAKHVWGQWAVKIALILNLDLITHCFE